MNNVRGDHALSTVYDNGNWYNDFADKLITGNFLLTALEFHAELIESGRELPRLKDFFSNPGNFEHLASNKPEISYSTGLPRSSSQATLDSLDLTRYSEDGERSNDDRVAVLEFELRKAKETIVALRANLTVATELSISEIENKAKSQEKSKDFDESRHQKSTIKPHEQRALNFLINEYLLLHGYKLTSITFSDENESQDFDDWDDVGLNIGRPLELLSLYREGLKASGCSRNTLTSDSECQVDFMNDIQNELKSRINELEEEVLKLNEKIASMNLEFSKKLDNLETQETIELESHTSLSPDPEYFEMIENIKSREESETKSDKSNGDWTKIGDKLKREVKNDIQSNLESIETNDKDQSNLFENLTDISEDIGEKEELVDKVEDSLNLETVQPVFNNLSESVNRDDEKASLLSENRTYMCLVNDSRNLPDKFKDEFLINCDMNLLNEDGNQILIDWFHQTDPRHLSLNQVIEIVSDSIPKVVPNIILNKREEIAPLLILSICLNPTIEVRDKLLNLLFNLKKKPQEDERRMILCALSIIAQLMGASMVENEVLPQCWEQITHKYVERRLLVAESCFILAPYVSEAIRNSLVMSITKQLLQDREENVRKSAVNILSLLVMLTSDEDKYAQVLEISLEALTDESTEVANSVKNILCPVLAQWSFNLGRIQSDLYARLVSKLRKERSVYLVSVMETLLPYLIMLIADSPYLTKFAPVNPSPAKKRQEFCKLCKGLCDPVVFFKGSLGKVMRAFDSYTSEPGFETSEWVELEWIWKVLIPALLEIGDSSLEDSKFLLGLMSFFRYLCLGLGKNVTQYKIKPILLRKLQECEALIVCEEKCHYSVIPLYLSGVLSIDVDEKEEMSVVLRKFICVMPLCGVSLTPLQVAVELLTRYQPFQILILDAIWEGVAHQRALVRSAAAKLFQSVIFNLPEGLVSTKVLPALITLSSDPEISVRTSSIPVLGMLTKSKDKAVKDKVTMTLQGVIQEGSNFNNNAMAVQLVRTVGDIYESCDQYFREEVLFMHLCSVAAQTSQNRSLDLLEALIEVFGNISFSQIYLSYHCITTALLPGLRSLDNTCSQMNLPHRDRIDSMIREVERRGAASKESACKSSALPSPSEPKRLLPSATTTQVVVEDVKNRVTKIFHTKPNTLQNVSGIFKKKS